MLNADGEVLLGLYRFDGSNALFTKSESLPDVTPVGQVEEVPGTGLRIYTGPELLRAGTLTLTLGTHGRTHSDLTALHDTVLRAAIQTAGYQRINGVLPIAHFSKITRVYQGSAQLGGQIDVTFEAAGPYFLGPEKTETVLNGSPTLLYNNGAGRAALRVEITAGASAVVNPSILTSAGLTTWVGTVPAGQTLTLDGAVGVWSVTLGEVDVSLSLTGPQPYLDEGECTVTLTAAGASALLAWQEGGLT
ncbi:hypothetical protein [Deinococcus irradiatisoli]|uniref:hypothetical protein n=1 Tax=Deinococcus irradiatisoli TaxID=2202254 RepID=UPI0015E873A4|nr:hypothetical protein [Deinococcus irradiatisoli]